MLEHRKGMFMLTKYHAQKIAQAISICSTRMCPLLKKYVPCLENSTSNINLFHSACAHCLRNTMLRSQKIAQVILICLQRMHPMLTEYHSQKIAQVILICLQRMHPLLTKYHASKIAQAILIVLQRIHSLLTKYHSQKIAQAILIVLQRIHSLLTKYHAKKIAQVLKVFKDIRCILRSFLQGKGQTEWYYTTWRTFSHIAFAISRIKKTQIFHT